MAVGLAAEGLIFEIGPGQLAVRIEHEAGAGDVVNELFGIVEVRTPGNIPGNRRGTPAYRYGGPVHRRVPGGSAALPGFAVETADVGGVLDDLAALGVGQHAHKGIAGIGINRIESLITNRGIGAFTPGGHVRFGLNAA